MTTYKKLLLSFAKVKVVVKLGKEIEYLVAVVWGFDGIASVPKKAICRP